MSVVEEAVVEREDVVEVVAIEAGEHCQGVRELVEVLNQHEGWGELLASSVRDACVKAYEKLSREQQQRFSVLPDGDFMIWPDGNTPVAETLEKYFQFLDSYVRWKPTERGHDEHVDECIFQLARFYWLIDQPAGMELQQHVDEHEAKGNAFTRWMVKFANEWGEFLNTSEHQRDDHLGTRDPHQCRNGDRRSDPLDGLRPTFSVATAVPPWLPGVIRREESASALDIRFGSTASHPRG